MQRGIDVVLEIDTPGHTASIYAARPDYVACFDARYTTHANEPPAGQLRFANDSVVDFATDLYANVAGLMSSQYVSTGGDEVNVNCMVRFTVSILRIADDRWRMSRRLGY